MYITTCVFNCFRKETSHLTTENNVYLAYTDLQMRALSEQKVDGQCADILSTDAKTPDYTPIDHKIVQDNHVYDVIST